MRKHYLILVLIISVISFQSRAQAINDKSDIIGTWRLIKATTPIGTSFELGNSEIFVQHYFKYMAELRKILSTDMKLSPSDSSGEKKIAERGYEKFKRLRYKFTNDSVYEIFYNEPMRTFSGTYTFDKEKQSITCNFSKPFSITTIFEIDGERLLVKREALSHKELFSSVEEYVKAKD